MITYAEVCDVLDGNEEKKMGDYLGTIQAGMASWLEIVIAPNSKRDIKVSQWLWDIPKVVKMPNQPSNRTTLKIQLAWD